MKQSLLNRFHVLWYDNNHRRLIVTDNPNELAKWRAQKQYIKTSSNDGVYKSVLRIRSYLTMKQVLKEDPEEWRRVNNPQKKDLNN